MGSKPRVIGAEVKKVVDKDVIKDKLPKPHISGVLGLVGGTTSEPHYVEVRDGQLVVYPGTSPLPPPVWRLALRHLHLQPAASGRPRGFSLTRHGERTPIATFQVDSELEYSRWVKTLAAELLKQTPLDAVKYLDILGITASIPRETRSLSPECLSEPESVSWGMRCSPLPRGPQTAPRAWLHRPVPLEVTQPLSLIITEEPKPRHSFRKALTFDSSPEDSVDGKFRMVDSLYQLAKQSKNCFRSCGKNKTNSKDNLKFPPVDDTILAKNRVKTLLKTFRAQEGNQEVTSPSPLHPLDIKDDGRTGRPPLPDVVKDLPPCDRRSRARTRTPTPLRLRGKSVDVIPSKEDHRVAELIARCQQEDRYVPVKDKKLLFESLGRAASQPRFVLSSDNLTDLGDPLPPEPPRTQSLHDLSANNVAVKEICRYFEQRGGSRGEIATRSPSPECRLRLPREDGGWRPLGKLARLRRQVADAEAAVWRLQDRSADLAQHRRGGKIQEAMGCRLEEERGRLRKLQEEQQRLQKEVPDHFGITTAKVRHHSDVR